MSEITTKHIIIEKGSGRVPFLLHRNHMKIPDFRFEGGNRKAEGGMKKVESRSIFEV